MSAVLSTVHFAGSSRAYPVPSKLWFFVDFHAAMDVGEVESAIALCDHAIRHLGRDSVNAVLDCRLEAMSRRQHLNRNER